MSLPYSEFLSDLMAKLKCIKIFGEQKITNQI